MKFYEQVIPRSAITNNESVEFQSLNQQYCDEFIEALGAAINQYSADGNRISFITSKSRELGKYMSDTLDEEWNQLRGMEVVSVGIKVSYDEESQALINMRNKGAMMSDPTIREGFPTTESKRDMLREISQRDLKTQVLTQTEPWQDLSEWAWV